MKAIKKLLISFGLVALFALPGFAWKKVNLIPSGDVVALTNTLRRMITNGETYDIVRLEAGTYDLSPLIDAPMAEPYIGKSLLDGPTGTFFEGATGNPDDVILDAKGVNARILKVASGWEISGITFKNGNACGLTATGSYNAGGAIGTTGGSVTTAKNCKFIGNKSGRGGAVADINCENCHFEANSAQSGWGNGGAAAGAGGNKLINCTFICNTNGIDWCAGGAVGGYGLVSGCTVISNTASLGGGLGECKGVTNCVFKYNYSSRHGGAVYKCGTITNCTVIGNAGGNGGVMANTSAYGTRFADNYGSLHIRSEGDWFSTFEKCDVSGNHTYESDFIDCVVHDISNAYVRVGNMHYPNAYTGTVLYAFNNCRYFRNSLVTKVTLCKWDGNNALFYASADRPVTVENCTFADNIYPYLARSFNTASRDMHFVNTAIVRNFNPSLRNSDVRGYEASCMDFANCLLGCRDFTPAEGYGFLDTLELGEDGYKAVRFVDQGEHPYAPKYSSPLRAHGKPLDWMDDATDLAGNPRLRDGNVDIGCYQCWLDPVGTMLLLR